MKFIVTLPEAEEDCGVGEVFVSFSGAEEDRGEV